MMHSLSHMGWRFGKPRVRGWVSLVGAVLAAPLVLTALWVGEPWHAGLQTMERSADEQRRPDPRVAATSPVMGPERLPQGDTPADPAMVGPSRPQEGMQGSTDTIVSALQGTRASLISLRGLPVQALPPTQGGVATAVSSVPLLFRHRAEIRLQGSVIELTQTLEALKQGIAAAPLRIEQLLLSSADSGLAMQATVVLTAINQERIWFTP